MPGVGRPLAATQTVPPGMGFDSLAIRDSGPWRNRTFSDAITAVRRWLWCGRTFATPPHHDAFSKRPKPMKVVLLYALAPAA
jgi:hypothetical protein